MKKFLLGTLMMGMFLSSHAQTNDSSGEVKKSIVKLNVTSLFLRNFGFQYEYLLSKRSSVAMYVRFMPKVRMDLQESTFDDDQVTYNALKDITMSNFSLTPEYRWYAGKGNGRGFYLAPFYRYSHFKIGDIRANYTNDYGYNESITMEGKLNAHSFGIMIGAQWHLGSNIMLDWWILGPHFGFSKAEANGTPSRTLSAGEQARVAYELQQLDIPFVEQEVQVTANQVSLTSNSGFGGIRLGACIGYRF